MNILIINHYAGSPEMGMEFRPYYFAEEWTAMGHRVDIIAADFSHLRRVNPDVSRDFQEEIIDGIHYHWIKTRQYEGNGGQRAITMAQFIGKLWLHTGRIIKELDPDSLTVHSLAVKRASKLGKWIEENGITAYNNTEETMEIAAQGARDMDMVPYYLYRQKNMSGNFENVGYSKEDKYGIYNILIMEEKQTIVACGAGTITKRVYPNGRIERCDNVKDVGLYIEKVEEMIQRKQQLFAEK